MVHFFNRSVNSAALRSLTSSVRVASTLAHYHFQPSQVAAVSLPLSPITKHFPAAAFNPPSIGGTTPFSPIAFQQSPEQQLFSGPTHSWNVVRLDPDLSQALAFVPKSSTIAQSTAPAVKQPDQVLVRVLASSVSHQDIALTRDLASGLLLDPLDLLSNSTSLSCLAGRLPLTPGRDFVGAIVARGQAVTGFKPGDLVWGTVAPSESNGAHADYVVTTESAVAHKPKNLSTVEAASIPYVGLTAWAAVSTFGELSAQSAYKKKVLILGGTEGVGCFAVQLLRYWGAEVTAICSQSGSADWLKELTGMSPTEVLDYQETEHFLTNYSTTSAGFDFILDASTSKDDARRNYQLLSAAKNQGSEKGSSVLHSKTLFVTLNSPLLAGCKQEGEGEGEGEETNGQFFGNSTIADALSDTLSSGRLQQAGGDLPFRWAYYLPNPKALLHIGDLVERGAIRPFTSAVFEFERALEAYQSLEQQKQKSGQRSLNGKVVLSNL